MLQFITLLERFSVGQWIKRMNLFVREELVGMKALLWILFSIFNVQCLIYGSLSQCRLLKLNLKQVLL